MKKSREQLSLEADKLAKVAIHLGYQLHTEAGPGLLESVYEVVLARVLTNQGIHVDRQLPVPIELMGLSFTEGFKADLLLNKTLLIELKSVEKLQPVHAKQTLTYLRLLDLPLGLLINFGAPTFKEGICRIVNDFRQPS